MFDEASLTNVAPVTVRMAPVLSWVQAGTMTNVEAVDMSQIGEWLPIPEGECEKCFYLKVQGLTQTQIATEINCSQNYVSNLENGLCGKRIGYDLGKSLECLWKKHCSHSPAA